MILIAGGTGKISPVASRDAYPSVPVTRLTEVIRRDGPEILGRRGPLKTLVLVDRRETDGRRLFVYRESFGEGPSILWTIELDARGRIASLAPRLEV